MRRFQSFHFRRNNSAVNCCFLRLKKNQGCKGATFGIVKRKLIGCASCPEKVAPLLFSVQRLHGFKSTATKVLVMNLYAVQYAIPARKQRHKTNHKQKNKQTQTNHTNKHKTNNKQTQTEKQAKTKQPKDNQEVGLPSNRDSCMMTSCV